MTIIAKYIKDGFLEKSTSDNEDIIHLSTPCIFRFEKGIVDSLRKKYKPIEEIGGVFSACPTVVNNERFFIIDSVNYIRNAIEDIPRKDNLNKTNAYLPDIEQLNMEISLILEKNCFPIEFHTHPTKDQNYLLTIHNQTYQTETSDPDRKESSRVYKFENQNVLLPRCLVVGSTIPSNSLFIGLYGGFVAPESFDESKTKVIKEKMNRTFDLLSEVNLTLGEKIGLGIGAALLLFSIIKYPKYSLPVIGGLALAAPALLTNTKSILRPEYFCKLDSGTADIIIP